VWIKNGKFYTLDDQGIQKEYATIEELSAKVNASDIVDNLTSEDTDKPLSANQGKILQDGKEPADSTILKEGDVENSLNSTSTTKPLSANQGKILNDDKASLSGANFTDMPQVGGVPIVESGSNSDGEFVRFSDGTQICYSSTGSVSINGTETNFGNVTWGQEFISQPIISTPWIGISTGDARFASQFAVGGVTNNNISTTEVSDIRVIRFGDFGTNPSGQNGIVYITAIGRWY